MIKKEGGKAVAYTVDMSSRYTANMSSVYILYISSS